MNIFVAFLPSLIILDFLFEEVWCIFWGRYPTGDFARMHTGSQSTTVKVTK